jgi:hypothetical protein
MNEVTCAVSFISHVSDPPSTQGANSPIQNFIPFACVKLISVENNVGLKVSLYQWKSMARLVTCGVIVESWE